MTEIELFEFNVVFSDVRRVFPLRADEGEARQLVTAYFKAFQRFPLAKVKAGAEVCIATGTKFPRPAEWIKAMPAQRPVSSLLELSALEAAEWLEAERKRWTDTPCGCPQCRQANVSHLPRRFVPEFDANDCDLKVRIDQRVVTRGHWAHGDELGRWYLARNACLAKFRAWATSRSMSQQRKSQTFAQRMDEIFTPKPKPDPIADREPGEDDQ